MNAYDVCPACSRHVKRTDATCPFCATNEPLRRASRASMGRRMSRGEWLALGSAIVLGGCSGKEISTKENSTAPDSASSVTSVLVGFECGDAQCQPTAEYCYNWNISYSCEPYDSGGWAPGDAACGNYPTRACSTWQGADFGDGVCGCSDDDAGAVSVVACHSCYGAPPARLERLQRVA